VIRIKELWSKRIWYAEILVLLLLFWISNSNIIVMFTLIIISVIAVGITSIILKVSENKKLDVKPVLNPGNSFSKQLINNQKPISYNEENYHALTDKLTTPDSVPQNMQQEPLNLNCLSSEQIENRSKATYVLLEGVKYHIRFETLKLRNKNIKSITDIQGLNKIWHLKKLDLSLNQIQNMKGIEFLPNLRILKLSYNKIQKIENIKNFQRLKKLTIDNNQLKELNGGDLPNTLRHINIAKNPIVKFNIYTKKIYHVIHFGPKKWFPKQELKSLKRMMRHKTTYRSYGISEGSTKFLAYFSIWAVITFLLAMAINLAFWGAFISRYGKGFWETLFSDGLWTFFVGGIGTIIIMVLVREGFPL